MKVVYAYNRLKYVVLGSGFLIGKTEISNLKINLILFTMKFSALLLPVVLIGASVVTQAQTGVAINNNGNPPDPSAMLDVSGVSKGVLINRMTTSERDAIVDPAIGLMVFNTTT